MGFLRLIVFYKYVSLNDKKLLYTDYSAVHLCSFFLYLIITGKCPLFLPMDHELQRPKYLTAYQTKSCWSADRQHKRRTAVDGICDNPFCPFFPDSLKGGTKQQEMQPLLLVTPPKVHAKDAGRRRRGDCSFPYAECWLHVHQLETSECVKERKGRKERLRGHHHNKPAKRRHNCSKGDPCYCCRRRGFRRYQLTASCSPASIQQQQDILAWQWAAV